MVFGTLTRTTSISPATISSLFTAIDQLLKRINGLLDGTMWIWDERSERLKQRDVATMKDSIFRRPRSTSAPEPSLQFMRDGDLALD